MSSGSFWTSRLLVVCACALLVYSFVALDRDAAAAKKAHKTGVDGQESSPSPRLVFMVIDAFRLSFLTSPESPMKFTKSQISSGSAHLFDAYARMPTVTLPRITAYITGTLPSFGTILTNFATDEIKIDNWVSRLEGRGKRVHFFGDDTWIRLLPGKFEKSEGVTSFFVNDYTEVDRNVTRHLDSEFQNFPDALILHYLGLDHIGHSLGGNSPQIPKKLREMDGIIRKIYNFLAKSSSESFFIVCGDHGMTPAGSHGGASLEETRVPVVVWNIRGKRKKMGTPTPKIPPKIEQIDISSTIFDLFGMGIPSESYGISLAHLFRNETECLEKQHVHFKNILIEKKLSTPDICDGEVCDYSNVFIKNSLKKWFREVQEELIGTASELPESSVILCVCVLTAATILSCHLWLDRSSKLTAAIFLVNFISFASSLIEEEHEIWHYLGSTVVLAQLGLWIKERRWNKKQIISIIWLGLLHRVAFGYMQSGRRRWSMDQNLLPASQFSDLLDLDVMDLDTYFKENSVIAACICLVFWGMFAEEPGIHNHFMIILPVVSLSLRVFEFNDYNFLLLNIIRALTIPIAYFSGSTLHGFLLVIFSICPLSQLFLFLIIYRIGHLSAKLHLGDAENLILCMASFFYTGNSNSLSTLSLTPAYVGLLDYFPIIVGFQLILYTFAGPILFICGQ
ncbi:hypothetical protein CAEBREN_28424 [Caenorhabditis brenneri]|uniref:GPI ethanolamine phosphate transferase 2 C-terminal domain-containing protein n=1 Tax=Caenorhabditis brenneri TaxID=135651 RepID=G0PES2_CAEBE|nr:hypothetical protein CAEBREN_28424 [Caenorhabditis brenneri]